VRIRLATFNLENFGAAKDTAPLSARIAMLRPQLLALDADIICLQEVDAQPLEGAGMRAHPRSLRSLTALLDGTPYAGFHCAATKNRDQADYASAHNVVLISRWPFAEVRQLWHDLVPEPMWRASTARPAPQHAEPVVWERPVLTARVTLPDGRALHLAGVHLRAPRPAPVLGQKAEHAWRTTAGWAEGYVLSEIKRAGQALEIRLWLDQLFGGERDALVAVLGDFNAEEHHTPVEVVLGRDDSIGSEALSSGALSLAEHAVPAERRYTIIHDGRRQMLDHILVSRALANAQKSAAIHNETLGDETRVIDEVHPPPQSFHAPVVAEFEVSE
jgi:endonuclease/exonuclease/phosphatase family metal-dependent hydrolase